ncbi:MAG: hypothetical protein V1776_04940 [Candidatus Diapherotrites archaeon]
MVNMPSPSSHTPKRAVVFVLEKVLLPSSSSKKTISMIRNWLVSLREYSLSHPNFEYFVASSYPQSRCLEMVKEAELDVFFPPANVWGVTQSYLDSMSPIDKERYAKRCAQEKECTDDYCRQTQLMAYIEKKGLLPSDVVLVGHDYWFDGFYTRRFSNVDVAFVESELTSRNHPQKEKISGLWYISRSWKELRSIIEGNKAKPDYTKLESWVNITLTEALFGGKGFPLLKKVVIQRKKQDEAGAGPSMVE